MKWFIIIFKLSQKKIKSKCKNLFL